MRLSLQPHCPKEIHARRGIERAVFLFLNQRAQGRDLAYQVALQHGSDDVRDGDPDEAGEWDRSCLPSTELGVRRQGRGTGPEPKIPSGSRN